MPNNEIEDSTRIKIMHSFGPKIGVVKLGKSVTKKFLELTDNILADKDRQAHGHRLAGQIKEETTLPIEHLKDANLYSILQEVHTHYVTSIYPNSFTIDGSLVEFKVEIDNCWIVSQYENEYNPAHSHDFCTLSSVLYLKIPEYEPRDIPGKSASDGHIHFINNSLNINNPSHLEIGGISLAPEVGDMYIFPSRLLHSVNPFLGPGERRSVSMNSVHYMRERNGE